MFCFYICFQFKSFFIPFVHIYLLWSSPVFSWRPASESTTSVLQMLPALSCGWTRSRTASLTPEHAVKHQTTNIRGSVRRLRAETRQPLSSSFRRLYFRGLQRTKCLVVEDENRPSTSLPVSQQLVKLFSLRHIRLCCQLPRLCLRQG